MPVLPSKSPAQLQRHRDPRNGAHAHAHTHALRMPSTVPAYSARAHLGASAAPVPPRWGTPGPQTSPRRMSGAGAGPRGEPRRLGGLRGGGGAPGRTGPGSRTEALPALAPATAVGAAGPPTPAPPPPLGPRGGAGGGARGCAARGAGFPRLFLLNDGSSGLEPCVPSSYPPGSPPRARHEGARIAGRGDREAQSQGDLTGD